MILITSVHHHHHVQITCSQDNLYFAAVHVFLLKLRITFCATTNKPTFCVKFTIHSNIIIPPSIHQIRSFSSPLYPSKWQCQRYTCQFSLSTGHKSWEVTAIRGTPVNLWLLALLVCSCHIVWIACGCLESTSNRNLWNCRYCWGCLCCSFPAI